MFGLDSYMTGTLKVAIELAQQEDYFVEAEEIKRAIVQVLQSEEGRALRERAAKYKTDIVAATAPGVLLPRPLENLLTSLENPPPVK
jgi:hypothetical protein